MAKKWNKIIARLEALEEALAGLLTAGRKGKKRKKKAKAKAKKPLGRTKAKTAKVAPARKQPAKAKKPRRARKPRAAEPVVVLPPGVAMMP